MNPQRLLGAVLLVVGVFLLITAMNASSSMVDRLTNFFTGHFTDTTAWYILGGVASSLFGFMLLMFGSRRAIA